MVLVLIGLACLLAVAYWASLKLHPSTTCHKCAGSGVLKGFLFPWARAVCPACDGTRLVPRLGSRLVARRPRQGQRQPW
jgi:hypothetical protein